MSEEEKKRLNDHAELAFKNAFYAMGRIDLLIVSISGASIVVCLEILKYSKENPNLLLSTLGFKLSAIIFVFSIVVNFIGQWCSFKSNILDYELKKDEINGIKDKKKECMSDIYDNLTIYCNTVSTLSMMLGLVLLISFTSYLL
jgi:hypothetical protein